FVEYRGQPMLFFNIIPKTPPDENPKIFIKWRLIWDLCHSPIFVVKCGDLQNAKCADRVPPPWFGTASSIACGAEFVN
ncbi:MAG: hypothetical protein LKJ48_10660, partial [Lactobacillus sp.]|nr:hypothetical protein [Lactobacillus sp.]